MGCEYYYPLSWAEKFSFSTLMLTLEQGLLLWTRILMYMYYAIMPSICCVEWVISEWDSLQTGDCWQQPICGKLHNLVVVCPLLGLLLPSSGHVTQDSTCLSGYKVQSKIFPTCWASGANQLCSCTLVLSQFLLIRWVSKQYSALHCMVQRSWSMFVFSILCEWCSAL
jgi:hypothetical protein